jgi:hypothetical protein
LSSVTLQLYLDILSKYSCCKSDVEIKVDIRVQTYEKMGAKLNK